jgi:hypothetical protein
MTCKTSCTSDADCVYGYACSAGGNCLPKLGDKAPCVTNSQCASGICIVDNNLQGPYCRACSTGASCPTVPTATQQVACGDDKECDFSCMAVRDPSACNADGSFNCSNDIDIPSTGPDCDTTTANHHWHCGALSVRCPAWMVCTGAGGTCKVTGGQACINNSDCYSGSCVNSKCVPNTSNAPCVGDWDGECSSNVCGGVAVGATQFKSACQ